MDRARDDLRMPADREDDPVVERRVGRVVLVDDEDAVFLLSAHDPSIIGAPEFWFTPGGGATPGETVEEAARREVYEEIGHALGSLGAVVWQRATAFDFDGSAYVQEESFFVVRTPRFEARPAAWTDLETRSTTGWRWWPVAELIGSDDVVYPSRLGKLVEEWLQEGPPEQPCRID